MLQTAVKVFATKKNRLFFYLNWDNNSTTMKMKIIFATLLEGVIFDFISDVVATIIKCDLNFFHFLELTFKS